MIAAPNVSTWSSFSRSANNKPNDGSIDRVASCVEKSNEQNEFHIFVVTLRVGAILWKRISYLHWLNWRQNRQPIPIHRQEQLFSYFFAFLLVFCFTLDFRRKNLTSKNLSEKRFRFQNSNWWFGQTKKWIKKCSQYLSPHWTQLLTWSSNYKIATIVEELLTDAHSISTQMKTPPKKHQK